ncbi:MAG: Na+/H+ antiporter NhaA [Vicinamibacterales bacterium]
MPSDLRHRVFQQFARTEAAGGLVLLAAALVALAAANSPLASAYQAVWTTVLVAGPESHPLALTARGWVNDALMALFFLLVGLEIKRELLVGELATARQAALPIAAALGGVVAPAVIFLLLAPEGTARGWAIPTATDIAFALAVLAIAAPSAPAGLKVFLAALAIVDDMSAVVVIALGYTPVVHLGALLTAAALVVLLIGLNRAGVRALWLYLALGAALWLAVHESGVHATIAGVVLALTIPTSTRIDARDFAGEARALVDTFAAAETGDGLVLTSPGQQQALHALDAAASAVAAPLLRLEHALHGVAAFVVMPVFAFANAGVPLATASGDGGLTLAVAAGLVVGKPLGITAAAWLACRAGLATLPAGVTWAMLHGVAWIAGIGFTMALFIAGLAFGSGAPYAAAQAGILGGSGVAAVMGAGLVRRALARGGTPA